MKARIELRPRSVEGIDCPVPIVKLRVRDRYGALAELYFRVDTQADFTSVPVTTAQREGIAFSQERERPAAGLVGETTAYRDRIRILIAGREHDWPCDYIKVPATEPGRPSRELLPVLGRAGFLDEYAVSVDSGYLIITRLGPFRRWLRHGLHQLWALSRTLHPQDRPL